MPRRVITVNTRNVVHMLHQVNVVSPGGTRWTTDAVMCGMTSGEPTVTSHRKDVTCRRCLKILAERRDRLLDATKPD